ncbi:AAA family ATPase [Poriferisphaera sp. WC338]|uniref:AAA family ATPase n=1 Tax=Poriferisphaera sp. WC338 TaxID=3425129 RepID=UPI003D819998
MEALNRVCEEIGGQVLAEAGGCSTAIVLVGMIGSGKSTFAKWFAKRGMMLAWEDALIESYHGGVYGYRLDLQMQYLDAMTEVAVYWAGQGMNVVLDSTNHTVARRAKIQARLKAITPGIKLYAIEMPRLPSRQHAEIRNQHDTRGYGEDRWQRVAAEHEAEYEQVDDIEGFDRVWRPVFE